MRTKWVKCLAAALLFCLCLGRDLWNVRADRGPLPVNVPTATRVAAVARTDAPRRETEAPTEAPTKTPTEAPTKAPTQAPTQAPTEAPTEAPTPTPAPTPGVRDRYIYDARADGLVVGAGHTKEPAAGLPDEDMRETPAPEDTPALPEETSVEAEDPATEEPAGDAPGETATEEEEPDEADGETGRLVLSGAFGITRNGGTAQLKAEMLPATAETPRVRWTSGDERIATVDDTGLVQALGNGTVGITAAAMDGSGRADTRQLKISNQRVTPTQLTLTPARVYAVAGIPLAFTPAFSPETTTLTGLAWSVSGGDCARMTAGGTLDIRRDLAAPVALTVTAQSKADPSVSAEHTLVAYPAAKEMRFGGGKTVTLDYGTAGATHAIAASILPENARQAFTYESKHPDVATVNGNGVITATGEGRATIEVRCAYDERLTENITVHVRMPVTGLTVRPEGDKAGLVPGQSLQCIADLNPEKPTEGGVSWSIGGGEVSAIPQVASISGTGRVTIQRNCPVPLTLRVTARALGAAAGDAVKGTYDLRIYPPATSIVLSKKEKTLYNGETLRLTAAILPAGAQPGVQWTSSNPQIATVDQSGWVTPVEGTQGAVTITAQAMDGTGLKTECKLRVKLVVAKLTITEKAGRDHAAIRGAALTLQAAVTPAGAADKALSWSVDKEEYAAISSAGVLTIFSACPAGEVITVQATNHGEKKDLTATMEITACPLTQSVSKTDGSGISLTIGEREDLGARVEVLPAGAMPLAWFSDAPQIVTVDQTGGIKAIKAGQAAITARVMDGSGVRVVTFRVTVTGPATVAATREEAMEWVRKQAGERVGNGQGTALVKAYFTHLGVTPLTGDGADYRTQDLPRGMMRIRGAKPEAGDVLVYTGGADGTGHVAIYEEEAVTYHQGVEARVRKVEDTRYDEVEASYWGVIRPRFR